MEKKDEIIEKNDRGKGTLDGERRDKVYDKGEKRDVEYDH